jgi:signal transduction histidine kinase
MQANGLRLLKLINNLLDLAKVESEQLSVRRVPLEVARVVGEVVDGARGLAERKGLGLEARVASGLGIVNADPDALEKVLVNLLGNALKFTEEGSVSVELESASAETWARAAASGTLSGSGTGPREEGAGEGAPGDRPGVHLVVRDTGAGIPHEQLHKVFDRFAQVDGSATRRHEGTGIGLSLVKELVELHGGRVWAESEGLGHGAAMHVVLPVGEPDGEADEEVLLGADGQQSFTAAASFKGLAAEVGVDLDAARLADMERTVERHEGARPEATEIDLSDLPTHPPGTPEVVIAEDNPEMRRLLAMLIGREFRVRPARHGAEALTFVRERAPELVVTDVMMPEMSGTELCDAIKRDPATRGVPVMLVTSKAEREMKIEGLELGAEDYVTKPFHPRELMARVRALVRLRSLQEELAASNDTLARSNADLAQALADLKEAEVQLVQAERLAAVGELSAGVAHEVNNPLNFARNALATLRGTVEDVQGFAGRLSALDPADPAQLEALAREKEALRLDDAAADLAELIGIVTEGLDRTAKLVAELRDFAAPARRSRGQVDVAAGLQGTLRLLGHRLREAQAELETDLPRGLPAVDGDAGALNQVFLNLLKNAAEALEGQGGGPLHVAARTEGSWLVVEVRDGGPGMDEATQARLFEPFFTTKEAGRGTGLGLSICQRIVAEHGGRIAVVSAPREGTTFTVRLPAADAHATDSAAGERSGLGA